MYWQDKYATPAHAVRALALAAQGKIAMTPKDLHIAHVAARSGMSGLTDDPNNLGSLKSFFKKVVKVANKLDPLYSVRKKIDPVTKAVNKAVGISSAPKTPPALVSEAPATAVLPNAPAQPIPELTTAQVPMNFSQGSGGGGGGAPAPVAEQAASDSGLSVPVMLGIGAAGLLVLYLLMGKRR